MLEKSGKVGERIDKIAVLESPPSIEMPSTHEQATTWQTLGRENSNFKPHKPLPRKRDTTISSVTSPDLRAQYRSSSNGALNGDVLTNGTHERPGSSLMHSPTTPVLPPTPPIANNENSDFSHDESSVADTTILRSGVVTPLNQQSPPTPDQTPPRLGKDLAIRPWLATQPSMASTGADSFATAREEFQSDTESEHSAPIWAQSHSRNMSRHIIPVPRVPDSFRPRPSPLIDTTPRTPRAVWEDDEIWASHEAQQDFDEEVPPSPEAEPYTNGHESRRSDLSDEDTEEHQIMLDESPEFDSPTIPQNAFVTPMRVENALEPQTPKLVGGVESSSSFRSRLPRPLVTDVEPESSPVEREVAPRRGPSLRDRLEAVDRGAPSASTEDFADQIGWSEETSNDRSNPRKSWRLSGISTISTVDAMVFDTEPRRTKTIRRQTKTNSLRTASSPLPTSNRSSIQANPYTSLDSPPSHSLSHKKVRLSNQNRLSYGSDASRSLSMSSAATPSKAEVIRVAVIPERRSSFQSSQASSRRHSTSYSLSSGDRRRFPSLHHNMHTHRLSSDGASIGSCQTCGKNTRYPPPVPPRASSLSAPTSRNNSRSNSITSDHLRIHRLQAEQDLRKTLDRMESERTAPALKALTAETKEPSEPSPPEPIDTPFSPPSVLTASGDGASIEMGEARAVNLFPHNNDSLQLIEKHPLPESRAVRSLRHTNRAQDLSILIDGPPTPRAAAPDLPALDSPLRNPRSPPQPPAFQIVPPTPTALPSMPPARSRSQNPPIKRYGSLRRPSLAAQRYSGSFIKSVTRGLSLKNARNPKSDTPQHNERLSPMWRPRRFWDDAEYTEDESDAYTDDEGEVRNTLGMPQQRTVVTGPVSLMRSVSEGRNSRKQMQQRSQGIYQQRSYGSLNRLRAARKLYKVPGFRGVHFQFVGLNAWQERMRLARNRKEDEKREERRRALRDAIGPDVVSQGDSRFPVPAAAVEGTDREVIH
jgi:hypothetical protein